MVSFSSLTLLPVPTFFVSERIVPERSTLLAPLAERRAVPQLLNFKSASLAPLRSALMVSTPVREASSSLAPLSLALSSRLSTFFS